MSESSSLPEPRCSGGGRDATTIALPVLDTDHGPKGTIRRSRSGRWRAAVLITIQVLMIAHLVQWAMGNRTTTPLEPSESMEFVKDGIVNAGLIMFALALLSTLILGRWFCGWACHVVLLQDACAWMMKKVGVRPRPFRSRLLLWVPLLLALYMFIWPAVFRWGVVPADAWLGRTLGDDHWLVEAERGAFGLVGIELPRTGIAPWRARLHLTTDDFWRTFPPVIVAVPFLVICGFGAVYFLGAKGFCTYGCPYGGFFAPLDKHARGRIRVTDDCEQCGHCTAVCTSNVRVHEEVAAYGMVVDPGCMKCLDCVSVCPKDALYFGFGAPATKAEPAGGNAPERKYDLSRGEELGLAAVFVVSFFSLRGVYGAVPMLMAVGIAICIVFLAWKTWRLLRSENVSFHRWGLKRKGSIRPAGWIFAAVAGVAALLVVHSGTVRAALWMADRHDRRVAVPFDAVFGGAPAAIDAPTRHAAERALRLFTFGSHLSGGGIGLLPHLPHPTVPALGLPTNQPQIDVRRVWLLSVLGRFDEAEEILRAGLEDDPGSETFAKSLALVVRSQGRDDEAMALYEETLRAEPGFTRMLDEFLAWCRSRNDPDAAVRVSRARAEAFPDDPDAVVPAAMVLLAIEGHVADGIDLGLRALELEPAAPGFYVQLGRALGIRGRTAEALDVVQRWHAMNPDDPAANFEMAAVLDAMGRSDEARAYLERARALEGR